MNSYEMIADHYLVVGGPSLIAFQGTPEDVDHKRFLMGRRDVTTDDYGNLHVIASHQPRIFGKWHYWMSGIAHSPGIRNSTNEAAYQPKQNCAMSGLANDI